jgi:hypothetical protein
MHACEHLAELGLDVLRADGSFRSRKDVVARLVEARLAPVGEEGGVSVSSSRVVGKHDPTAFTCAPRASQRFSTTGSVDAVVVQTTSAPKRAASTDGETVAPTSPASSSAASSLRAQIRISGSSSTARIART